MRNLYFFLLLICTLAISSVSVAQRVKYHRVSLQIAPERLEYLFNHGLDIDHFSYQNKRDFTAELSDNEIAVFTRDGFKVNYLIRDLEKNYAKINEQANREAAQNRKNARAAAVPTPTNFSLGSYGGYYTYADIPVILDRMRSLYPNLISVRTSIGSSIGGRPLYMVKISDNPDVDENEPELMLNALHHAREPITLSQLIFFMWHVLENYNSDKEIRTLLNSSEMYIIPCVNPDGYVYNQTTNPNGGGMWRKNRRVNSGGTYGVDLNRNYSYNYGLDNTGSSPTPSSDSYRGTGAFSEPETATIRNFAAQHQFVTAFTFHSYGNYCTYPLESVYPNTVPELALFRSVASYMTAENGYKSGNAYETVGYKANGTANDWAWGEQVAKNKIYGFLSEIGSSSDGFWPASSRIIPLCNDMLEMNKKLLRVSTFYGRATPTGSTVIRQQTSSALRYQFQNFSIKPASYTVTASGLSSYVTSVEAPKTYSGMAVLQTTTDSLRFTIDANTPSGTQLAFELAVDNGLSIIKDTVTYTYTSECAAPTGLASSGIQQSGATLTWNAVSGSTFYAVSVKPKSATTWPSDVNVTSTVYTLTGLTAGTAYDWRVKASCGTTYATASFTTVSQTCFAESGGMLVVEAESYQTSTVGTGAAAGRSWSLLTSSSASGSKAMTVTGVNVNVQNSLVGPRLDYALNFTNTGTYYVWVRMAAGSDGVYDDSFHLGLDGNCVTLNPNSTNYSNGSQSWTWVKSAGSTVFKVVVSIAGAHTLNLWMREDGIRVDKFVLTTSSSYTPSGTGPAISAPCGTPSARIAVTEPTDSLQVLTYPNPFDHSLTIKVNASDKPTQLRMIGIGGQTHQQMVVPANVTEHSIHAGNLPAGAYFLEVIRDSERKVIPLRKQ